jgi:cytoskeletal protein CcmA (bactofilin family)
MFGSKPVEPTVIGRGAVIEGTVRASGRIQIDGTVEGTLEVAGHVSVGPSGRVVGELVADDLVIGGRVEGKVTAKKHLHVASTGSIKGEVQYGTLQVDRGATMEGNALHGEVETKKAAAEVPPLPRSTKRPLPMAAS